MATLKRRVTILEKAPGPERHRLAWALNDLAGAQDCGDADREALKTITRALEISEAFTNPEYRTIHINILDTAGSIELSCQQYHAAEGHLRQALRLKESCFPMDESMIAHTICNLAEVCDHTGRLSEARDLYKRALQIHEKATFKDENKIAEILKKLGDVLHKMGLDAEAASYRSRLPR